MTQETVVVVVIMFLITAIAFRDKDYKSGWESKD